MAILNYTTEVDAIKSISEIEYILIKHGVKSVLKNFRDGHIESVSFLLERHGMDIPITLPARVDRCLEVLKREKKNSPRKNIKATYDQAERVAWRILKDWTEAQMALIDIDMVQIDEVFLPYIQTNTGKTVYELMEDRKFLLEDKRYEI